MTQATEAIPVRPATATAAVRLEGVTKTYGSHRAVDDLSLLVPTGSVYGFIGPNGSGKTTTIRMILHIILPDAGRIEVLGREEVRAANDRIGYLPEERGLYKKMTVRRLLTYYASLKGMGPREARGEIERWLERMDLADWRDKKVEALSKGMSQKIQFVATVLAQPELIILDEPFSGLDPVNLEVLRDAILELRRDGATVIFSTHDMSMAEKMCDSIFMIYRGRKVLDGSMESIRSKYGADTIRLRQGAGGDGLAGIPGVQRVTDFGRYQELQFTGDPQRILEELTRRTRVELFEVAQPSLHDIFVRIAKPSAQDARDAAGGGA